MTASFYTNFSKREMKVMEARHIYNSLRLAAFILRALPASLRTKTVKKAVFKVTKVYEITLMPVLIKLHGGSM